MRASIAIGKTKRLLSQGAAAAALCLMLSACASYPSTPEGVYLSYNRAIADGDFDRAMDFLTERDRLFFWSVRLNNPVSNEHYSELARRTSVKVESSAIANGTAELRMIRTRPDISDEFLDWKIQYADEHPDEGTPDYHPMGFGISLSEKKEVSSKIIEKLRSGDYRAITDEGTAHLVREDGKWKISLGYDKLVIATHLLDKAHALVAAGAYDKALEILDEAIAVEGPVGRAASYKEEVFKKAEGKKRNP